MVNQSQVFGQIQHKLGERPGEIPRKADVTIMMKKLYHPSLDGDRLFYSQGNDDVPMQPIRTDIGGVTSYCTIAATNVLNAGDWQNEPRPAGFVGPTWPPTRIEHLLGRPHFTEYCIGCNDDTRPCNCSYEKWSALIADFVTAKIAIRAVPNKGDGGFARGKIYKEAFVGEFTGRVLPRTTQELGEADQYYSSIMIGEFSGTYEGHPSAWVDCAHTGSIARFYNHSCEPNAKIWEYRSGMSHRILVYQTLQEIEEGEEITVDYGENWFAGLDQLCLCETASCKNPPIVGMDKVAF